VHIVQSKTQTDKLGERIRKSAPTFEAADRVALQQLLADQYPSLITAQRVLEEVLDRTSTGRLKTAKSTVEKLRRQTTRLSQIQDLAGLRIVIDGTRLDQDELEREIRNALEIVDRDDRRKDDQYGYRALHLVARVDGCLVEIQIRTRLQHGWAEVFEKLADAVGREIRYGMEPSTELGVTVVERLRQLSETIARVEAQQGSVAASVRQARRAADQLRTSEAPRNRSKRRRQAAEVRQADLKAARQENLARRLASFEHELLGLLEDMDDFVRDSIAGQ
jgi:ppGpp synthetase/RelA/SpoT-type nucleotidyltranferase